MAPTHEQPWFHSARVSWRTVAVICGVWAVLLICLAKSPFGPYLESRLASPVAFRLRHMLHLDPPISPHLKIYGVDDSTVFRLKKPTLSGRDWAAVFTVLAKSEPRTIVIDAMFSQPDVYLGELQAALTMLRQKHVDVIVGSFFNPKDIAFRTALSYRDEYDLKAMLPEADRLDVDEAGQLNEARLPPMRPKSNWIAYGPTPELAAYFARIGHFAYDGDGRVAAMIRLDRRLQGQTPVVDGELLPPAAVAHMGLYLAPKMAVRQGKLILGEHVLPLHQDGQLTVNFPEPAQFAEQTIPVWSLLDKAAKGQGSSVVKKDDVVLIIPGYYTGDADIRQTPFGMVPGGFVIASVLNSVLNDSWLKPVAGEPLMIIAMAAFGAVLALNFGVAVFWLALFTVLVVALALSMALFAYLGIMVPWMIPLSAFACVAISVFAEKSRLGEQKALALRASLAGLVAPGELKNMLKKPEGLSFEARERVVTLMFIDVVGFSLLAESILPRVAFEQLKRMLANLGDSVHEFGGIIDKTLGDGLLCYFGYRFDGDQSIPDHAEQALACAIKIQRDNLARNLEAQHSGEAIHPLRIGINTASCYLGDLGSASRLDFTVVGNGVNFAKRLEGACEMHTVLMGATTHDLVRGIGLPSAAFSKRLIHIKHHSELVEAFEYDPFFAEVHLRQEALEGFRRYAKIDRIDQHWPVHDGGKIEVQTTFGHGQLVNFSQGGLRLKFKQLLAPGTPMTISLASPGGGLQQQLQAQGIESLVAEVRWSYAEGAEFIHGVLLTELSTEQANALVVMLSAVAFAKAEEPPALSGSHLKIYAGG